VVEAPTYIAKLQLPVEAHGRPVVVSSELLAVREQPVELWAGAAAVQLEIHR